jgi:hypothetical protein
VTSTIVLNFLVGVWLLIVVPGFVYAVQLVREARRAMAWLRANSMNGYRSIVANGGIYRGQIRVLIFGCMVLMGLDAASSQFFVPGSDARNVLSAVFRLLFIVMALAMSYKSYLEHHELDLLISEDHKRTARTRVTDAGEKA